MQRYFIQLSYNGTPYHGWQVQENTPETVQQVLNEALSMVLNEPISTTGCGRTDTGVHAKDYYAHFDCSKTNLIEQSGKWLHKFNSVLPKDIAVYDLLAVSLEASSRFDAISRTYQYVISTRKNPFLIDAAYFYSGKLDVQAMNEASALLFNHIDFSCFSKSNTQTFTNNCKIMKAEWELIENGLVFTITADRFLRNMVRAIVGTLLEVGEGKMSLKEFNQVIESKSRSNAGFSVPACGLYLTEVRYPIEYFSKK